MDAEPVKFGTSGLRGPATGFTPTLTNAYVTAFLESCCARPAAREIAIGMDLRSSSLDIAAQVAAAADRHGFAPINCGTLPTPALAAFALARSIPAIMVTGSHIPADYNGLKFYRPEGELRKGDEGPIELLIATSRVQRPTQSSDAEIAHLPLAQHDAVEDYIERYLRAFPGKALSGLNIGVFEHSAVGRDLLVGILERLGATVTRFGRSEAFVAVDTEALEPEHLELAWQALAEHRLDAVVSTDGDGDRPLVIDKTGNQINGDILGALTARFLKVDTVVTPLTSTSAIESSGWFNAVHRTRIGSPYVVSEMEKSNAESVVGFEANGGFLTGTDLAVEGSHLPRLPTRDAVLPIIAVLALTREQNTPLSELSTTLPPRVMRADRLKGIPAEVSAGFVRQMAESQEARQAFDNSLAEPSLIDTTDGTRLTLSGGTIVHFRASGNAPELRCYVETDSAKRTEEILVRMISELDQHLRSMAAS